LGLLLLATLLMAPGTRLLAQTAQGAPGQAPEDEGAQDEDPSRTVLFNVRLEHRELLDGASQEIMTLRRDVAIPPALNERSGHKIVLLRFDLPLVRVERNDTTDSGLGDLYAQVLHVHPFNSRFALAAGTGLFLPTASEDSLGTGKWQLAPAVVPVWQLPKIRGLAYVKFQDYFSVAGDKSRSDLNTLAITPTLIRRLGRKGFMLVDSESRTDWRQNGRTSRMSGLLLGHVINRHWGFWAKVEVPWGENRTGDWTLRTSLVRRQVR
jgi:hypothetical protein